MNQQGLGEVVIPASALHMSDSPVQVTPAPDLGNITDKVYSELLGMTADEIKELKEKEVI